MIPCLTVDVTDEEAGKTLATHDLLTAMAGTEAEKLKDLLGEISTGSEVLAAMIDSMASDAGIVAPDFEPVGAEDQGQLDEKAQTTGPYCGKGFEK